MFMKNLNTAKHVLFFAMRLADFGGNCRFNHLAKFCERGSLFGCQGSALKQCDWSYGTRRHDVVRELQKKRGTQKGLLLFFGWLFFNPFLLPRAFHSLSDICREGKAISIPRNT